ncbi:PREDICTED: sex-determining region Y protein-like, partial [Rhagoletis zephyria]|uniref:sex-determining region Y protein-like n=1 Tax=Rhagoletis zephyria TaxID=28612 RepID=UPI000811845D
HLHIQQHLPSTMNRPQAFKKKILEVYQAEMGQPLDHSESKDNNNALFNEKQNNEPLERVTGENKLFRPWLDTSPVHHQQKQLFVSDHHHQRQQQQPLLRPYEIGQPLLSDHHHQRQQQQPLLRPYEIGQPLLSANQAVQQYYQLPIAASNAASVFASVPNNTADWNYKQLRQQQPFEIGHFLMPDQHHPQQHQQLFENCQPLVSANPIAQQYYQLPIAASNAASAFVSVPNNTADWNYKHLQNQQPFEIGHFLMPEHHHQQHQQQPSNINQLLIS